MKICVFAYNFPHKKTQEFLISLFMNGINVHSVFAANKIKLKIKYSKERVIIKDLNFYHPRTLSRKLNSKYFVLRHDSKKLVKILKKEKFDLGIIAGARIIKKSVIECFKIGILNLHPGLLPINRGLDTHKWAVLKNWPQCVTAHLIDEKVDMGKFICKEKINVYLDDTLVDINYRLQSTEIDLMLKSINILKKKKFFKKIKVKSKNLHTSIDPINEKKMTLKFSRYKRNYGNI